MQRIAVGSTVRVVERPELEAFLRSPDPGNRPEPGQFAGAGRSARVLSASLRTGEPLYVLQDLPGVWREAWLRPV